MNDTRNDDTNDPQVITAAPAPNPAPTYVVQAPEHDADSRGFSFGSFLIGVLVTLIAGAIAIGVFLAVSDSDDDGNIQLDVPAVDVDTDG